MIVNKGTLADILGVNEHTLTEWQRAGMPVLRRDGGRAGNQYDTVAVRAWDLARVQAESGAESNRDRLARLQGDSLELELQEKRRSLVPASEVEPAWEGMVVAFRQVMLSLPGRVVPMLAQCEHEDAMREVLRTEIEAALIKLSSGDDEPSTEGHAPAGAREGSAAAADSAIGVGRALS